MNGSTYPDLQTKNEEIDQLLKRELKKDWAEKKFKIHFSLLEYSILYYKIDLELFS